MRKFILSAIIVAIAISCNSKSDEFTLTGTVMGDLENGTKVYLKKQNEPTQPPVAVDTAAIENGVFKFSGKDSIPSMYFVQVEKINGFIPIIIENGDIELSFQKDSLAFARRKGTPQNDMFDDYMQKSRTLSDQVRTINQDAQKARNSGNNDLLKSLQEEYTDLQEEFKSFEVSYIKENPNALISVLLIEKAMQTKTLPDAEVRDLFDGLSPEIKKTKTAKNIEELLAKGKNTSIGSKAPNFTAPTPTGEELALNDVLGKATIVDFWAAWCKPCRAENPNVVNVYNKYHEKGLNIIGVSLDKNAEDWKKAIEDDGLIWDHVSHVQYFKDPIAKLYNVDAIPAAFILDENGVIVAKNLRGQALEDKISEMLQ